MEARIKVATELQPTLQDKQDLHTKYQVSFCHRRVLDVRVCCHEYMISWYSSLMCRYVCMLLQEYAITWFCVRSMPITYGILRQEYANDVLYSVSGVCQ